MAARNGPCFSIKSSKLNALSSVPAEATRFGTLTGPDASDASALTSVDSCGGGVGGLVAVDRARVWPVAELVKVALQPLLVHGDVVVGRLPRGPLILRVIGVGFQCRCDEESLSE